MSAEPDPPNATASTLPGWNQPRPERLPEPTSWPAATAMAVALILWGLISTLIITAVGVALFIAALAGWVGEIRHERSQE